ncbi:MAG: 4Fe-4S binding protein [Anaerolineae bacterium]
MADLSVREFAISNPFIIAASPATHGAWAVLKSALALPGAVVMRNYRHGAGGGALMLPSAAELRAGRQAAHSHALGAQVPDPFSSLAKYCQAVSQVRREMPSQVKLWVSVGHFQDTVTPEVDWQKDWTTQARELERAGANALEVHFNTPGVAVAGNRVHDFYRLIYNTTRMIKAVASIPVMVKLPVEACDPLRAMEAACHAGADAVGPTARWKGFVFDLDWRRSLAQPGGGYGGSQALPIICYTVAEARLNGLTLPMYAGGGVFDWVAAAKLIMAGSQGVQLGTLACCHGPRAVAELIAAFARWMDEAGYPDIPSLCGDALALFRIPQEVAAARRNRLGEAYRQAQVDAALCSGCGNCEDACWYDAISVQDGLAVKGDKCIGCGYCFQVCPTRALSLPQAGDIVAAAMPPAPVQ